MAFTYVIIKRSQRLNVFTHEGRGPMIFLGGMMLVISSILEFVLGNTFPCVVFGTIGMTLIYKFGEASRLTGTRWLLAGIWCHVDSII